MTLTFIGVKSGKKECRQITFLDHKTGEVLVDNPINTEKGLLYYVDCKDNKFKSCRIKNIVKQETDFPINKLIKDKEVQDEQI
jgi:hypothetical protein